MKDGNYALYYPTIEFRSYDWLCSAALLWDRIYRIVPSSYVPSDDDLVRALVDTGEIGIPIHPDDYLEAVRSKFVGRLLSGDWTAAALSRDIPEEYVRIHKEKVDVKLRELIVAKGKAEKGDQWLHVPVEFEAHYMTYLANEIAERNNLSILSDRAAAWTGATYFKYDGEVEDFPREDLTQVLAAIVIRDCVPVNLTGIPPKDIIRFRNSYRDERRHFLLAMKSAAERISACEDRTVIQDYIQDIKRDVESALEDYRRSLRVLNIAALAGIKTLTFPASTQIASVITGQEVSPATLAVISALGLGFGIISGFSELGDKKRSLRKDSDYSYLMHLGREWKKCALYNNDFNYYLCRQMEEFIND